MMIWQWSLFAKNSTVAQQADPKAEHPSGCERIIHPVHPIILKSLLIFKNPPTIPLFSPLIKCALH